MKEDELSDVDRLVFLMEEIAIIESRFQPEDTGHLELLLVFSKKE